MSNRNILQALQSAGGAGGAGLDVDEVFSTFLYEGNGGTQTITNGIDLTEGGLVWNKARDVGTYHALTDTERGGQYTLYSPTTDAQVDRGNDFITSFNSNGYSIGADGLINDTNSYVSWTFRKAPKFFDVVTYTGNGSGNQTFNHSLGCVPGMVIIKNTSRSGQDWWVWVNDSITANEGRLNDTGDFGYNVIGTVTDTTVQTLNQNQFATNYSGDSYVAYLFAHNNNDGEFGPDGDADIIKCGSFTGNGSSTGPVVDLGFEPQWLLVKNASASSHWYILDVMRGWDVGGSGTGTINLRANAEFVEQAMGLIDPNSTGFQVKTSGSFINGSGNTIIYMAIRRGSLNVPDDATKVFGLQNYSGTPSTGPQTGFVTDFSLLGQVTGGDKWYAGSRLTGINYMKANTAAAETTNQYQVWDRMDGAWTSAINGYMLWGWKRAPGYFDVVTYTGNGGGNRNITHNLGSAPGMLWLKRRDGSSPYGDWYVQHTGIAASNYLKLNENSAKTTSPDAWNSTYASADVFRVGSDNNVNTYEYIVYLFGTVAGVSKVGSYTGNGSSQNIDCGFSNGARFVLIKRTDGAGNWCLFDTARGIVSGNDFLLRLNNADAQSSDYDQVDPLSSGFTVVRNGQAEIDVNYSGLEYIFYAIA